MNVVDKHRYKCQKDNNPSFSSTLLDVIYRSIDERVDDDDDDDEDSSMVYKKTVRKQQSFNNCLQNMYHHHHHRHNVGSKSGNIGSCLETETIYGFPTRPRPIRTSINTTTSAIMYNNSQQHLQQNYTHNYNAAAAAANNNNVEVKNNKSRAMKIYGYIKRGKQPISPGGGRLASFLVSLFTTKYVKKSNISSSPCTGRHDEVVVIHDNASRNSKSNNSVMTTPKGKTWSSNGDMKKRYPGKEPRENGDRFDGSSAAAAVTDRRDRCIKERTRSLLESYEKKVEYVFDSITNNNIVANDDDDETGSYASSDLFELDHLSGAIGIGIDQCMQELPLYETTSVAANTAIANGFVV